MPTIWWITTGSVWLCNKRASSPIGRFELSSRVVTPNGDLANDELLIEYDLINVDSAGAGIARLELYGLAGARIGVLQQTQITSGRIHFSWPGTDGDGQVLPPGLYILRLAVGADRATDTAFRSVAVAY